MDIRALIESLRAGTAQGPSPEAGGPEFVLGSPDDARLDLLGLPPGAAPGMGDHQMPHQAARPGRYAEPTGELPPRAEQLETLIRWLASRAGPNPGY